MLRRWLFVIALGLLLAACRLPLDQAGGMTDHLSQSVEPTLTFPVPASATATAALSPTIPAAETPAPSPTPLPVKEDYTLQVGSPVAMTNFLHPQSACDWAGISGQVFDFAGNPVKGLVVRVSGSLDGTAVEQYGVTGAAEGFGPGGFEVVVSDQAILQPAVLQAQVFGQDGLPLSAPVEFQMPASCEANLVLLNFVSTKVEVRSFFIPITLQGIEFGSGTE